MAEYPLIVVPEWEYLEPAFKAELRAYVEEGGHLLLIGPQSAALFEADLGVDLEGTLDSKPRSLSLDGTWTPTRGEVQSVKLGGGARAFGRLHATNDSNSPSQPAASITSFGKGKIAATYFAFGQGYLADRSASARRFLDELTRQLVPNRMVEVKGSPDVDVVVNRVGDRLAVNLVNTAGPHRTEPILESIPPVGPLSITIRTGAKPAGVTLHPGGKRLDFEYADGAAKLTLPRLEIHDVIVVDAVPVAQKQSLAGPWRFALDRTDSGVGESWFDRRLDGQVRLPGTLAAQGIGDEITVDTPWTGSIVDRSYFTAPEYRALSRARQYQGAILVAAGEVLRGASLVPA